MERLFTELTTTEKIATYRAMRASGLSDVEIRKRVENQVGTQADADWAMLRSLAEPVTPQPAAGGVAPLLLAVAAAYILGA